MVPVLVGIALSLIYSRNSQVRMNASSYLLAKERSVQRNVKGGRGHVPIESHENKLSTKRSKYVIVFE